MTRIDGTQQVGVNHRVETNGYRTGRTPAQDYTKRSDYLEEDTLDISSKKKDDGEKGIIASTCETIGNGVKSFVNMTVNAFAKAASEVVVDKAVDKLTGK